ncbi:MAG: GspE/PulE family protein [bacterium]
MNLDDIDDELLTLLGQSSDVTDDEINTLMRESSDSEHTLAYHVMERNIVDNFDMRGLLEEATGYEALDPDYFDWDERDCERMTRLLPADLLHDEMIMPVNIKDNTIKVIMLNPTDEELKKEIQARTGCRVDAYVSYEQALNNALENNLKGNEVESAEIDYEANGYCFEPIDDLREEVRGLINKTDGWRDNDDVFDDLIHSTPVLLLAQEIMNQIMWEGGSDIHFETMEERFRVRVRRDGELRTLWEFPRTFSPVVLARIRQFSNLPFRPADKPQDARIGYSVIYDRNIEYRVSCLPTLFGEKIVLRTIDLDEAYIPLDVMGFRDRDFDVIQRGAHQPNGMVLVTGPTGSGKTTTLYSLIDQRNEDSVSITTAEDPIEAQIEGVSQVECAEDAQEGVTFAEALKSFLRQDPDIIMVGEIRDRETGEIAIEAAMTGHLVLSTLHTNSAAETVNRLLNMDIEPYLLSAGLSVVVSQRLIRTLCEDCKTETEMPEETINRFNLDPSEFRDTTFYEPVGCDECDQGFDGRTGLFEVLEITDNIREAIFNNESTQEIEDRAREQDFNTLLEDGIRKVKQGITTLDEVLSAAS